MASEPEKSSKAGIVLEALRSIGRGSAAQVAAIAETTQDKACAHLCNLRKAGLVDRVGERGAYTWFVEA